MLFIHMMPSTRALRRARRRHDDQGLAVARLGRLGIVGRLLALRRTIDSVDAVSFVGSITLSAVSLNRNGWPGGRLRSYDGAITGRKRMKRHVWLSVGLSFLAMGAAAQQQKVGDPPEASNMKLVGWSDLQARSAYQPTIHKQGDRWIAYIGHHGGTDDIPTPVNPMTGQAEPNGTSIVDVTDPAAPKYLRHISRRAGQVRGRRRADGAGVRRQRPCPRATSPPSTCCAPSAARRTRSGTSPIRPSRCCSRGSTA